MRQFKEFPRDKALRLKYILFDIDDTVTENGKLLPVAFQAMWDLSEYGFRVIPVTGRPAGWCDLIIRQWPVDAVIGENGAFCFYLKNGWSLVRDDERSGTEDMMIKFEKKCHKKHALT